VGATQNKPHSPTPKQRLWNSIRLLRRSTTPTKKRKLPTHNRARNRNHGKPHNKRRKSHQKTASALLKLLIPNATTEGTNREEIKQIIELAIEFRNQVREWLHLLAPGEYPKEKLYYKVR